MDNADRIDRELRHEQAGIWYISDHYGAKILAKLPSSTIKAIIKGCKVEFIFGLDEMLSDRILHTGLRIYDDQENPQLVLNTQFHQKDHFALAKIMSLEKVQIQFCNELNAMQMFCSLSLDSWVRHQVLTFIANPKHLYYGTFTPGVKLSLDRFQATVNFDESEINSPTLPLISVSGTLADIQSIYNTFYQADQPISTNIEEKLEGRLLEKEILVVLQSLFENDVYHEPRIKTKTGHRELIDLLGISDYGIFLIEAKAMGVMESPTDRTMKRKAVGLKKQIHKAIKQLAGASRTISTGIPIYDARDCEITFDRNLFSHSIILVSEMLPFGNRNDTVKLMIETMAECKTFLHVMDLKDLLLFIGHSNGNKDVFDDLLIQRAKKFAENPVLHVKTEFYPLS